MMTCRSRAPGLVIYDEADPRVWNPLDPYPPAKQKGKAVSDKNIEQRIADLEEAIAGLTKGDQPRGQSMSDILMRSLFDHTPRDGGGVVGELRRQVALAGRLIDFVLNPRAEYNYATEKWVVTSDTHVRVFDKDLKQLTSHEHGDPVPQMVAGAVDRLPRPKQHDEDDDD